VIPSIASDLFQVDEDRISVFENDDLSHLECNLSIGASQVVLAILQNSAVFSDDVRSWAMTMARERRGDTLEETKRNAGRVRDIVRSWWRENELHFAAKDYANVKRGAAF